MQLIVTVKKLNKRRIVPAALPDRDNIIGEVIEGFSFEGEEVAIVPNPDLGKWYKDRDGSFYWGGGVSEGDIVLKSALTATKISFKWFQDLEIERIWNLFNEKGENVTIAILDTGYNIANDDLSPAVVGVNVFDGSPPIQMSEIKSPLINDTTKGGHGTFCASIIAARNSKLFNIGIAPKSKLLVGKISKTGGLGTLGMDIIINGIEWAVRSGAEIISISFGKFRNEMPDDEDYLTGIQIKLSEIIKNKNVLIFASSGDNPQGSILEKDRYPASLDGCVSVGATNNGILNEITVLSPKTIIHAQGVDVESYTLEDAPGKKSGTSMSVPIVAGIAGLAVSHLKKKNNGVWDSADLLKKIYDTATTINISNKKNINPTALFHQL